MEHNDEIIKDEAAFKGGASYFGSTSSGIFNLDVNAKLAFSGKTRKLQIDRVIVDKTVPKHFIYELNSRKLESETAAYLLNDVNTLKDVKNVVVDAEFWDALLKNVTASSSGMISPNSNNIPFSLVHARVAETLTSTGFKCSSDAHLVVSMLSIDLLNALGLMGSNASLRIFDTKLQMFANRKSIQEEMYLDKIKFALDQVSFDRIEEKKKLGIAGIVDSFESSLQSFVMALDGLHQIPQQIEALVQLVRCYITNDYSSISNTELFFFEGSDFREVAHNATFIQMAMEKNSTKPTGGSNYWARCLQNVTSAVKSSSRYEIVELKAIQQFFSLSSVESDLGFRKGVIISKNMEEKAPLEILRVMTTKGELVRLVEDKVSHATLVASYNEAARLKSTDIHVHASNLITAFAEDDDPLTFTNIGASEEDLKYLALTLATSVYIDVTEYETTGETGIVYGVDISNSLIRSDLPTVFNINRTKSVEAVILYGAPFMGSKFISFTEKIVTETKNVSYSNIEAAFTDDMLSSSVKGYFNYAGDKINYDWNLEDLAGLVSLEDTYALQPLIGQVLYSSLFTTHAAIISYQAAKDGGSKFFGENAALALVGLLDKLVSGTDLDNIVSAALLELWHSRKASGTGEAKFSASIFAKENVRKEIKLRVALFILYKLNFIGRDDVKDVAVLFKKAGSFKYFDI